MYIGSALVSAAPAMYCPLHLSVDCAMLARSLCDGMCIFKTVLAMPAETIAAEDQEVVTDVHIVDWLNSFKPGSYQAKDFNTEELDAMEQYIQARK